MKFVKPFAEKLMRKYISLPNEIEAQQIALQDFGFPRFYGSIDSSQILIPPPRDGYRKNICKYSMCLQVVVDDKLIIGTFAHLAQTMLLSLQHLTFSGRPICSVVYS